MYLTQKKSEHVLSPRAWVGSSKRGCLQNILTQLGLFLEEKAWPCNASKTFCYERPKQLLASLVGVTNHRTVCHDNGWWVWWVLPTIEPSATSDQNNGRRVWWVLPTIETSATSDQNNGCWVWWVLPTIEPSATSSVVRTGSRCSPCRATPCVAVISNCDRQNIYFEIYIYLYIYYIYQVYIYMLQEGYRL